MQKENDPFSNLVENEAEHHIKQPSPVQKRGERLREIDRELKSFNDSGTNNIEEVETRRTEEFETKKQEMESAGIKISAESHDLIRQNIVGDRIDYATRENERFDGLQKEKKVISYLNENLSETEDRIKEPMNKECEVSIVIPAYGEREAIFRPIESLTRQKGISRDSFEAIFVINNPGKAPEQEDFKGTDNDYKRKFELYHKSLAENQECLKIIRHINGENIDVALSVEEKEIVEKIKSSGIKIFAIDKATPGKTLPRDEANVGGARNRGVAEAVARFYEQKKSNGIIAQSDADTILDENYLHNLIKVFKKKPELVGIAGELEFEQMEDSELIRRLSWYGEMEHQYNRLLESFVNEKIKEKDVSFSGQIWQVVLMKLR